MANPLLGLKKKLTDTWNSYVPYTGQVAQGIGRDIVNLNNRVSGSANKAFNQTFVPWSKDFQQQNQQFTNYSRTLPETSLGGRTAQFMEGVRTSVPGMNLAFRQSAANDPTTTGGQLARLGGAAVPAVLTAGTLGKGSFGSSLLRATPELGLSAGLGAGINTAFGGSPIMGAAQGLQAYNYTKPIGMITNPLIEKFAGKAAGSINNPFTRGIVGRGATGLGNVPEGMIMNASRGQSYTPFDFAMDTGTGVLFGGGAGNPRPKSDFMAGSKGAKNLGQEIGTLPTDFVNEFDNKLRREISDSVSKINGKEIDNFALNGITALGDILKHSPLYKAYPELKMMKVEIDPNYIKQDIGGTYDPVKKSIKVGPDLGNTENLRGNLIHEIQHAIQMIEGFAKGANGNDPNYRRSAGEIESKAAELRRNFTQRQLDQTNPYAKVMSDRGLLPKDVVVDVPANVYANKVDPLIEEARKYKSAEEFVRAQTQYLGDHRPDSSGSLASDIKNINDLRKKIVQGGYSSQLFSKLEKIQGNPEAEVTIYRTSPKNELNYGDWVTIDRDYATRMKNDVKGKIYTYKVKAKDLVYNQGDNSGNGFNFGYFPQQTKSQLTDIWNQANKGEMMSMGEGKIDADGIKKQLQALSDSKEFQDFYKGGKISGKSWNEYQRLSREYRNILDGQTPRIDQPKLTGMGEVNQLPKQEVKGDKYAFNINKMTLGTSEKANEVIDQAVEQVRPILEANKGKKLTHKEIIREGKKAAILDKVMTREEIADFAAKLQATRNMLKSQSESTGITQEYLDNLAVLSSTAADAGRRLNAFSVGAEDVSLKQQVVKELLDVGVEANKIIEGAKNVDWNNAKQVTEFYRKYKPARLGEYLTEFRYTNMLSSPLTHIVNTFSNLLQGGVVAPVEKTVAGGLDFAYSKLTGAERKYFASQGIDYTKGFVKAIPEAFDNFRKAFSGGAELSRPDLEMIPTTTNKYWNLYKTPLTALEAADQFFKTLVRSGEMESLKRVGKTGAEAEQIASRKADYRLFRQAFDPEGKLGQGKVLQYWDKWNSQINRMRQLPGGKWIVPFLQTPTNILKQGVEYSPLGAFTAIGAREPIEQLSKASIGSAVFMAAYGLANSGLTTWDAPTSAKEKEEFYAAGLQPYSIKMGDKWVSYSKLGPLSYPIAMASALKWAGDNDGGDDVMSNLGNGIGGSLQFFADQSYVRGIGDIIDALRGDEYKQSRALANIPLQTIPYDSFQGWVTRIIDPVYRKTSSKSIPDAIKTNIMAKTPGLSNQLPAYQTPFGEQSNRQFPKFNAVSPFAVTQESPNYMAYYENKQVERNTNRELTAAKNEAKATLTSSGNISNQGEKVFYNDGTSVNTLDLGKYAKKPTDPIDAIRLARDQYSDALKVFRADGPSKQEKSDIIRKIGLKPEDISYYDIASDTEDIRRIAVDQVISGSNDQNIIKDLSMLRDSVNGKMILTNGLVDDLYKEGIINKSERDYLKDVGSKVTSKKSGSGSKSKAKLQFEPMKLAPFKQSQPMNLGLEFKPLAKPQMRVDTSGAKRLQKITAGL